MPSTPTCDSGGRGIVSKNETEMNQTKPPYGAWKSAVTVLQAAHPPSIPEGAEVMTVLIQFPPGDPGTPPHRHPGPAFGYMLEGEMRFELEEPERVIRAVLGARRRRNPLPGR